MRVSAEIIREAFNRAKTDLVEFRRIMLVNGAKEVRHAPFHMEWSNLLLGGKSNVAIQGYRESAKTQYILRAFPLYALRFPQEDRSYIVLIKNNTDLARAKLREIETEYTTNPALNFNLKEIKEQSSGVFAVDVYDPDNGKVINVRIEAYGKGASIRGLANLDRRPHICIIDDPQDLEDAKSDTILEGDWNWFLSDVKFLGQSTRIFVIGNNLGEKSMIERIFTGLQETESFKFDCYRIPAMKDGRSSWPEKQSVEDIEREREDYRRLGKLDVWFREKMCQAIAEESRTFKKEDFRYYAAPTVERIIEHANVYFTIDPASSTEKESCYRAIVVNAVNEDNYWFIVDVPYGRWDSTQLIDILFDKVRQWKPRAVGIEKGMYKQIIEPFIQKEMARRNVFFTIEPIEHAKAGSKLERVKMLGPRYKAHTIWHPDTAEWLAELESELSGVTKDGFKSMYVDLIDALAMQEQLAQPPFRRSNFKGDLPRTAKIEMQVA